MPASPALAALLLAVAALLLASSVSPAAAAVNHGGGRMVIIRAAGTRVVVSASGARSRSTWHDRRLVEDEVAPEFVGGLLGAGGGGHISYEALKNVRPACGDSCAAKGGKPYTRPCIYKDQCRGGPPVTSGDAPC